MTLVREMPVNRVSQIIGVDDNKLWRMMRYYVAAARQLEDYSEVDKIGVDETSMNIPAENRQCDRRKPTPPP